MRKFLAWKLGVNFPASERTVELFRKHGLDETKLDELSPLNLEEFTKLGCWTGDNQIEFKRFLYENNFVDLEFSNLREDLLRIFGVIVFAPGEEPSWTIQPAKGYTPEDPEWFEPLVYNGICTACSGSGLMQQDKLLIICAHCDTVGRVHHLGNHLNPTWVTSYDEFLKCFGGFKGTPLTRDE